MESNRSDMSESSRASEPIFEEERSGKRNKIIIGVLAGALLIALILVIFAFKKQGDLRKEGELTKQELVDASAKLESLSMELDQKIEEIQKLGGDIEDLQLAREEIEKEKENLRKSSNVQISRLRERVQGYETLLKNKDAEIAKLQVIADSLMSENTTLKSQQNELQEVLSTMEEDKGKLEEQVAFAGRLKAENIKVYAINKRGKEREGEFKGRQVDKLKMEFNIGENNVAPIEGKEILVRVIEPAGNVIFDVATGSGTFTIDGREEFYTVKQDILFDNTRQTLTFLYEKPSEFKPGQYTLEIYTDEYVMGSRNFTVK